MVMKLIMYADAMRIPLTSQYHVHGVCSLVDFAQLSAHCSLKGVVVQGLLSVLALRTWGMWDMQDSQAGTRLHLHVA